LLEIVLKVERLYAAKEEERLHEHSESGHAKVKGQNPLETVKGLV
jgi:hypothetical protein